MAFNIVAQIQLQAPGNINQVVNQINGQLKNINASINIKIPTGIQTTISQIASGITALNSNLTRLNTITNTSNTNISGLNTTLNTLTTTFTSSSTAARKITSSISAASDAFEEFGRSAGLSTRRFLAFSLISNQIVSAFNSIGTAVRSALEYDREFIKLQQVGESFRSELSELNKEIGRLSSNFGASSQDLIRSAVTLRQAGFSIDEVKTSLQGLAQASLAPSFGGDLAKLAEGLIAIRQQFRLTAEQGNVAINSINAVANAFAVESKDIVEAIQRSGGAFRSIGGDLNEFQSLFTSVRATTRESVESIATGLRTIFTRLQRPELVSSLEDLGVNLRYTREEALALGNVNLERQFVGGYEAVRRLSSALQSLPTTDPRYAQIIEDISGNRQISKIVPLLQEFTTSQNALNIAQASGLSLTVSADIAQQNFLVNLNKLKESFLTLTRTIVGSSGFAAFTQNILNLGNSLAYLGNQLAPIIPLITTLATIRLATGAASFLTGFGTGFTRPAFRNQGGPIGMASGGVVPGSGNTDSVPANLMPGEFVIKQSSAKKIGYDTLHAMNGGRVGFASGGFVSRMADRIEDHFFQKKYGADVRLDRMAGYGLRSQLLMSNLNAIVQGRRDLPEPSFERLKLPDQSVELLSKRIQELGSPFNITNPDTFMGVGLKGKFDNISVEMLYDTDNNNAYISYLEGKGLRQQFGKIYKAASDLGVKSISYIPSTEGGDKRQQARVRLFDNLLKQYNVPSNREPFANGGTVTDIRKRILATNADFFNKTGVNLSKGYRQINLYSSSELEGIVGSNAKAFYENKSNVIGLDANSPNIESLFIHEALHGLDRLKGLEKGFKELNYSEIPNTAISRHIDTLRNQYILPRLFGVQDKFVNYLSDSTEILAHSGQGILGSPPAPDSIFAKAFKPYEIDEITKYSAKNIIPKLASFDNINNYPVLNPNSKLYRTGVKLFASGGATGTDVVPAMLTPGEFVVNREAAKRIGYSNLHSMNRTGQIQKFAKGGVVYRANGTPDFLNGESAEDIFYRLGAQFGIFTGLRRANTNGSPFLLGNVKAPLGNPFQYNSPIGPQRASFGNFGNVLGEGGGYGPFPPSRINFPINTNAPSSDPIVRLLTQIAGNTGTTAKSSTASSTTTTSIDSNDVGGLTKGTAFLAAIGVFAASYAAQFADQFGGNAQNAIQSGGGRFVTGKSISGAISGALPLGVLGAQFFGPVGAGIGALVGGGLGAIGGAQQARSELSSARIEESQRTLSDTLRILSNRNDTTIGASQADIISTSIREAFNEIREKAITDNQRFYIFGTNNAAADSQITRDRRIFAQSQVDSSNRVLLNTLSEQARQLGGTSGLNNEQLRNRLSPAAISERLTRTQEDLLRFISVGSGESTEDILQRFSRQLTQTALAERVRVRNVDNAANRDSVIIQFDRLASILERVGNDFENLGRSLELNSALFEGRFALPQRRLPGANSLFGVGDAGENAAIISGIGSAIGGTGGARFTEFGSSFDSILRDLFEDVASNFNNINPLQGTEIAQTVRNQIEGRLGGRNNLNASQRSILSDVETNLARLDPDRLRQLIQSGNREGLNRELTQGINFGQNFDQIIRQFQEAVSQFDSALQGFERRNIEQGNTFSQSLVTQRNAEQFNRISEFIGQGITPTGLQGLLPLNEANAPATGRLQFLARQIGAGGIGANDIGERQRAIQNRILAAEQERNNIVNPRDARFRQLTIELAGLQRQSAQATQALTDLANATTNVARQERLNALVRNRDNRLSFAERVLTSSPAELAQRQLAFRQFGNLIANRGNLSDLPFQTRGEIFSALRGAGPIPITQLGATPQVIRRLSDRYNTDASNLTAEQIIQQEILRDPRTAQFARQDESEIQTLIREIRQANEEANRAQNIIFDNQKRLQDDFFARLNAGFDRFFNGVDQNQNRDQLRAARANLATTTGNLDSAIERVSDRNLLRDRFGIRNQNALNQLGNLEGLISARTGLRNLDSSFARINTSDFRGFSFLPNTAIGDIDPNNTREAIRTVLTNAGVNLNQEEFENLNSLLPRQSLAFQARGNRAVRQGNYQEFESFIRDFLNTPDALRVLGGSLNRQGQGFRTTLRNAAESSGINVQQLNDFIDTINTNQNFRRRVEGFNGNGDRSLDRVDQVLADARTAYAAANAEVVRLTRNLEQLNQRLNPEQQIPQANLQALQAGAILGTFGSGLFGQSVTNRPLLPPGVPPVPIPGSNVDAIVNAGLPINVTQSGQPGGVAGIFTAAQNLLAQQAVATVDAGRNFVTELNPFIEALKNFPQELTGSFTHNVNLNINGAEALSGIEATMKEYVVEQVKDVMRNYIRDNLFEAGQLV